MQTKNLALILAAIMLLLLIGSPKSLLAATVTLTVPNDFSTIQAAIDNAASLASANTGTTYSVLVEPGTYPGGIVLRSGISIAGRETARTIISGGGTGTAVTANGITGIVTFSNFTITTATTGIQVTGNSTLKITNSVFMVGTGGTAIQIQGSPNVAVINNTFYQNGTAVTRDSDTIQIINNIFSNNTTNISQSGSLSQSGIDFNCFNPPPSVAEPVGTNSIPNTLVTNPDPLFVDPSAATRDFHLQQGSPCIDAGTNINGPDSFNGSVSDIGAYGGPGSDAIPLPVGIQSATVASASSIALSWTANSSYLVTNTVMRGGYNIYYSLNASGAPYQVKSSIVSTITSTIISGLTSTSAAPTAPVLFPPSPANASLMLSWSSVSGATGYNVHYGIASTSENTINVGNVTSFVLSGLTNGQPYKVAVSAVTQSIYFIAVTAVDNTGSASLPGVDHESIYSQEASVPLGPVLESGLSNEVSDFPEAIAPYPNLPNKGCFIATAAYGVYSAPQVQVLREFRDRYLMTNSSGRAFVHWYYQYGPTGATFLNAHPWLKPAVQAALMPAVGGALFLTRTSLLIKLTVLLSVGFLLGCLRYRKKFIHSGGMR
jgi:hypothetical protein